MQTLERKTFTFRQQNKGPAASASCGYHQLLCFSSAAKKWCRAFLSREMQMERTFTRASFAPVWAANFRDVKSQRIFDPFELLRALLMHQFPSCNKANQEPRRSDPSKPVLCRTAPDAGKRIVFPPPACLSYVDQCNVFRCGPVLPGGKRSILSLWLSTRVSISRISICASRLLDGSESILLAFSCGCRILLRGSDSINAIQSDGDEFWWKKSLPKVFPRC